MKSDRRPLFEILQQKMRIGDALEEGGAPPPLDAPEDHWRVWFSRVIDAWWGNGLDGNARQALVDAAWAKKLAHGIVAPNGPGSSSARMLAGNTALLNAGLACKLRIIEGRIGVLDPHSQRLILQGLLTDGRAEDREWALRRLKDIPPPVREGERAD